MSIASFYAKARWGSRWGVKDAWHRTPHRGFDIRAAAGTAIPALRSGTVVLVALSPIIGGYFVTKTGLMYLGYCHTVPGVKKGQVVAAGQTVGRVASAGKYAGSAWGGPHLHLTRSAFKTGVYAGVTGNPQPIIEAALKSSATAGGGTAPIIEPEDDEMYGIYCGTRPADQRRALILPYGHQLLSDAAAVEEAKVVPFISVDAEDWARHIARAESREAVLVAAIKLAIPAGASGTVNVASIADAVDTKLSTRFAPLTAIQNTLARIFK